MNWYNGYESLKLKGFISVLEEDGWFWIAKRLSGNDTNLTKSHQVGVYLPKAFFEIVFPEIVTTLEYNPKSSIYQAFFGGTNTSVSSEVQVTYYNNIFFPERSPKGTRNEFRLTSWGGRICPLQRPENTGSIWLSGFKRIKVNDELRMCNISWVTDSLHEEKVIEKWLNREVEPTFLYSSEKKCLNDKGVDIDVFIKKMPEKWHSLFPTCKEIVDYIIKFTPQNKKQTVDNLLLKRRGIEFKLFAEIERLHLKPKLKDINGDVDKFVNLANSVTNRRKSRSGRSLELHLATILRGAGLSFEEQAKTELKKKPDFLFPGAKEYHQEPPDPEVKLYMLGAKTCCKERWRQILDEVKPEKIQIKHLFTLQNGVSVDQMVEMKSSQVQLVVPEKYKSGFHKDCRPDLMNLNSFIEMIALSQNKDFSGAIFKGF